MAGVLIALIVFGFCLWLISFIPMNESIRKVIYGLAILLLVIWLIQTFLPGSMPALPYHR